MNEDYLWDKSGEPDSEIERLENTLGRLRYQRPIEPLPLPVSSPRAFRYGFSPMLAAAAAFVILLLAGGVWLSLRRTGSLDVKETVSHQAMPGEPAGETAKPDSLPATATQQPTLIKKEDAVGAGVPVSPKKQPRRLLVARARTERHPRITSSPPREQRAREGENARAQLIMALHIASDKLNVVQKKIQTNPES